MKKDRWIVLLAVGGLVLGGCAQATTPAPAVPENTPEVMATCRVCPTVEPPTKPAPTCNPEDTTASQEARERGWILLQVSDPADAASYVWDGLADDFNHGNDYVIVRADVVDGESMYNLVIPVDAAMGNLDGVADMIVEKLTTERDQEITASTVLRVVAHEPVVPHEGFSFITPGEFERHRLPELCPPGRHPQSPGANPWG